ncbi:hypothetical protein KVT40_008334 [Elsinoe batatas]|uniref:Transport protein USO1 n=1 Tax=Elsinoe batatas TaxID=2601811 RepID=A0A8K0KVF6_9PEZI|nr:hypothetical protein KVT40_008334 [Elsinoe batatas]
MPSVDREASRDRDLRHQHSYSESGRLSVPMWDSADPDRCPPPLPIPPGSPSLQTKSNASAGIQAAANKLHERARESLGSAYLANASPSSSPEKSLIKGAAHRRMQSAHASNGKDLKSYLDGMRSGSPERTPGAAAEYYSSSSSRPDTPTRASAKPILGENTPPSATMRALQSAVVKDDSFLSDMTNGRISKGADPEVSAQLLKLTTIATNLQTEMAALSRRSKDNAVDLLGLKEAATKRDEDIKKNIKDLITSPHLYGPSSPSLGRSTHFGLGLLDSKAYGSPPPMPRAASHNSLIDAGSPSPYSVEGAASVAMLEKIIREMVTKEGQERLLSTLSELMDKSSKMSTEAVTKVEDLAEFIKEKQRAQALNAASNTALVRSTSPTELPADLKTLLGKIKDSVTSNGGMTAEIKALIRELRGEILGMGRELGRKLDQVDHSATNSRSATDDQASRMEMQRVVNQSVQDLRDHMENLIQESAQQSSALVQARGESSSEDMYAVVKHALSEHGDALAVSAAPNFDKEEILSAVRTACENFKPEIELQQYGLERDEILEVLKEGLGEYRASEEAVAASQVNKQEVFDAMQEALQSVQLPSPILDTHAIKADMLASIRECLEEFKGTNPALGDNPLDDGATRELINDAIRTGLEEHSDKTQRVMEISRDDLFDAVKAGLDGSSIPFGGFGEQVLQQLHELVDGMKVEFKQYSAANGRDTEQVLDAVKDGLEVLRGQIEVYVDRAQGVTGKDEIIEVIRTGLENLRMDVQGFVSEGPNHGKGDLLDYIRSEFEHLHATIGGEPLDRSRDLMGDKSDILAAIEGMRSEVGARSLGSEVGGESMESVKEEIAHLRDTLAPLLIKVGAAADKDEMLATIKEAISELPSQPGGINTDVLEAIRGEFENLQSTVTRSSGSRADMEEMLDTIRLGLDDLRSHVDKKTENPEKHILNGEILDALNEGLDNLRSDVNKTLEKPVDMTVTYEILDTLKEGLAGLRADMDKLSSRGRGSSPVGDAIVLADASITRDGPDGAPVPVTTESLKKDDLEKMEVLLAQLQIKVEAMDQNIQDMPVPEPSEGTTAGINPEQLAGLEGMIKDVQSAVADIAAKERAEIENAVTKADTDAIETLLRNTKSQIEELRIPGAEDLATREQSDAVEAVARVAKEAIDALTAKVEENIATKADVAVVEVLASDVKAALDELKEKTAGLAEEEEAKRLVKSDIDVLGVICTEIKDKVSEMVLPDVDTLPDKADVEQLQGLINDLREGQEKFQEQYDKDIGVTAQAFDDRRKDTEEIVGSVTAIKSLLEEFSQQATDREEKDDGLFDELKDSLTAITEKVETNPSVAEDVKALVETVKTEFEKATASLDAIKTDHGDQLSSHAEKSTEHKDAIIADLSAKIDLRMDELVAKYIEAQTSGEEKAAAQEELVKSTKDLADELKLSIDTLGTALTASTAGFNESSERLSQESKTVFNRVDDVFNKLDETQTGLQGEHAATRDEVTKVGEGIAGLREEVAESNPKILIGLQELKALVEAHYDHAKTTAGEHADALRGMGEKHESKVGEVMTAFSAARALPDTEEAGAKIDESALHEKLDQLLSRSVEVGPDTSVHEKLDKLAESVPGNNAELLEKIHAFITSSEGEPEGSKTIQLERLDAIHVQMMATAAKVTAFVATQTQRISDEQDMREREAEELGKVIAQRETRKEDIEADIDVLSSDRDELREEVARFREEKEALGREKAKLAADVHALHAALVIRKEELAAMEMRADQLERRVLEGLMDQSRAAMIRSSVAASSAGSTGRHRTPKTSPRKKPMRDLRVVSGQSEASTLSTVTAPFSVVSSVAPSLASSVSIAAQAVVRQKVSRPSMARNERVQGSGAERRIMSLSQISHNAGGGSARQSLVGLPVVSAPRQGLESLKRSQSVRTSGLGVGRKSSWSAGGAGIAKRGFTPLGLSVIGDEEGDKENEFEDAESRRTSASRESSYTPTETGSVITGDDRSRYSESFVEFSDAGSRRTSGQTVTDSEVSRAETFDDGRKSVDSAMASLIAQEVRERIADGELDDDARTETDLGVVSNVGTINDDGEAEAAIVIATPVEEDAEDRQLVLQTGTASVDFAPGKGKEKQDDRGGFATPADSGLGSDLPTAALGSEFGGYFPRAEVGGVGAE